MVRGGQFTCFVDAFFDAIFLQTAKKRRSERIGPAVPAAAHAVTFNIFASFGKEVPSIETAPLQ